MTGCSNSPRRHGRGGVESALQNLRRLVLTDVGESAHAKGT